MKSGFLFRGVNVVALVFAAAISTASVAAGEAPGVLLERYKCSICHADQEPKAGPAYVDIAAKYRGNPKAVSTVAAVVRSGAHGGGPWHMPPHPEVSEADATTLARYILSRRPQQSGTKE